METLVEQTTQLLIELAGSTSRIEEIIQEAYAARWAIAMDDQMIITAELDARRGVLNLATDLGRPSEKHRSAICEALLLYSSLQQSTGGIAMALTEQDGDFQQLCDVTHLELNLEQFSVKLLNFAEQANNWRAAMQKGLNLPHSADALAGVISGAIRC
jgi:hypothetical protein